MVLSLSKKWNRFEHPILGLQFLSLLLHYKHIVSYGEKETMIFINLLWFSEHSHQGKEICIQFEQSGCACISCKRYSIIIVSSFPQGHSSYDDGKGYGKFEHKTLLHGIS